MSVSKVVETDAYTEEKNVRIAFLICCIECKYEARSMFVVYAIGRMQSDGEITFVFEKSKLIML